MSTMDTTPKKLARVKKPVVAEEPIEEYVRQNPSVNALTWRVLGGKDFMPTEPVSAYDLVLASDKGISKQAILHLADVMDIPMKDMASLLNLSYKTLGRKRKTDLLDRLVSSLSIEIASTVANGLSVFEDAEKLKRWLQKENRSLNGRKPIELLNTPTGINMVNRVLSRLEEGVYS
jgi:putative toxin-antitoxin system antitoxin component (TIGR02293 family)